MGILLNSIMPIRIHKLTDATINKIAAGEVIERPASVVKELLENALDAGATQVVLELQAAGKELIKVTDNGHGIARGDAELVFERYATSKIETIDDIYRVHSMGFRGEALSSIAAIADVEIITNQKEGEPALLLSKRPNEALAVREAARTVGTTVSVRDIFHSIPVRRKFLSSDASELGKITAVFSGIAVGRAQVGFRLISDGKEKINLPPVDDPAMRIGDVYGRSLSDCLLLGRFSDDRMDVKLYFSNLDYTRNNRTGQLFFVNQRLIESRNLERGVRLGYRDLLPPGRFPVVFAFLAINPDEIDVNVHPTKREIRFSNEESAVRALSRCITDGFRDKSVFRSLADTPSSGFDSTTGGMNFQALSADSQESFELPGADRSSPLSGLTPAAGPDGITPAETPEPFKTEFKQLLIPYFQLHNTYILCQIKKGLLIIDQHVAHERILYERALKGVVENEQPVTQQLLFPVMIDLSLTQKMKFDAYKNHFAKTGFSVRALSGNSVVVDGVPSALKDQPVQSMIIEIIDAIAKDNPDKAELDRHFAKSYACGAAIKAGQPLSLEEINNLVDLLFQCENPYTCPHGRPIVVRVPLEEIDRRFMR